LRTDTTAYPEYTSTYTLIKTLRFGEVTEVKLDTFLPLSIPDAEVKPLNMSLGIGVDAEEEVVFVLLQLDHAVQVARLE
jgi:hypothetical protein